MLFIRYSAVHILRDFIADGLMPSADRGDLILGLAVPFTLDSSL